MITCCHWQSCTALCFVHFFTPLDTPLTTWVSYKVTTECPLRTLTTDGEKKWLTPSKNFCQGILLHYTDDFAQDCSNSSESAMELLQSCVKPSIGEVTYIILFIKPSGAEARIYRESLVNIMVADALALCVTRLCMKMRSLSPIWKYFNHLHHLNDEWWKMKIYFCVVTKMQPIN